MAGFVGIADPNVNVLNTHLCHYFLKFPTQFQKKNIISKLL